METRANYLMVGIFVLLLAGGAILFVIWLAKFQFDVQFARYDIRHRGSITGLNTGSPVRFHGVRVGEVLDIGFDQDDPEQILITIEVEGTTPIRSNTVATLEIEGLTGGLYVLLTGASKDAPPLSARPGEARPSIPSESSTLQQVLEGAPELVQKVNLLLAQASDLLNAENRAHVTSTLANLDSFSTTLAEHSGEIGSLIADASETSKNLRGASAAIETLAVSLKEDSTRLVTRAETSLESIDDMANSINSSVSDTAKDARALMGDLRKSAKGLHGVAAELEAMVAENREPVRDFTATGLSELAGLLIEMRELVIALNRVTTEMQRDPARFFFGNQQQGYETR